MSDNLSPKDRRKTMQAVKGKGTRPEKRLFSMLVRMGLKGWRKNANDIIGKPDVAFISQRVAIFIDGCFWHGCPHCKKKLPKANREYWKQKIESNVALARAYNRRLRATGWKVIRIWEHDLEQPAAVPRIKNKILASLESQE